MRAQQNIPDIIKMMEEGISLEKIGEKYGVSKQRIYQILTKHGIDTPIRKRKNWLRDKPIGVYWLNHLLTNKQVTEQVRMEILNNVPIPEYCPILGTKLNYAGLGEGSLIRRDDSPSLDQIIPGKGYTPDNVQVISWRANRIKNDSSPEELMKIAMYMCNLTKNNLQV